MPNSWGYCKSNGPSKWADSFPLANGARQSPIDIRQDVCLHEDKSEALDINHEKAKFTEIVNTGAGWKVEVDGEDTYLTGGPLKHKFKLIQFHCHWGKDDSYGSEHTIEGKSYPAEIHLVHWNCEKYQSFEVAAENEDGLAVLGIFLTLGDEHTELRKVISHFPYIKYLDESRKIDQSVNIDMCKFVPAENRSYWTYPGSLTTPPCLESVTWMVFKEPIEVSENQLEAFRSLHSYGKEDKIPEDEFEGKILQNYRPPMGLGERTIRFIKCE